MRRALSLGVALFGVILLVTTTGVGQVQGRVRQGPPAGRGPVPKAAVIRPSDCDCDSSGEVGAEVRPNVLGDSTPAVVVADQVRRAPAGPIAGAIDLEMPTLDATTRDVLRTAPPGATAGSAGDAYPDADSPVTGGIGVGLRGGRIMEAASSSYAMVTLYNYTSQSVSYDYKWGSGTWKTGRISPSKRSCYWWKYPSGSQTSSSFYIRYRGKVSVLRRKSSSTTSCDKGARYEFRGTGLYAASGGGGEVFPGDWTQVALFKYNNWSNGMYVGTVVASRRMGSSGYSWNYKVAINNLNLSSGLPCLPGQHWEGYVRARVTGTGGGYLDTGDLSVHSGGGTKEETWDSASPGNLTNCTLYRRTWCEW